MMAEPEAKENGSIIFTTIRAIAMSPEKAMQLATQYKVAAIKSHPGSSTAKIEAVVSKKIKKKYAKYTALSGGAFALPGIIPGVGTAAAMVGGGAGDATVCLKAQVDMTMLLAANFGWDLTELDAQYMAMLVAVSCGLEKLGVSSGVPVASKAGVRMLRQYLKGATLKALKEFLGRFGITFARASLEKAFPFGIGVAAGFSLNYVLTRYVGWEAVKCFTIERQMRLGGDGIAA